MPLRILIVEAKGLLHIGFCLRIEFGPLLSVNESDFPKEFGIFRTYLEGPVEIGKGLVEAAMVPQTDRQPLEKTDGFDALDEIS